MTKIARIGIDTSKSSFQLHGVDADERVVLRKVLRRKQFVAFLAQLEVGEIGLEACGASHHWGRALRQLGHQVVLVPPQYVKAYVARGKNDKNDAEAICEAISRPRVRERLVPVKSLDQSASQMLLGVRESLIKRRTQLSNSIRGHAAEFGLVAAKGTSKIERCWRGSPPPTACPPWRARCSPCWARNMPRWPTGSPPSRRSSWPSIAATSSAGG